VRFAFHNPESRGAVERVTRDSPFGIAPHWRRAAPSRAPPPTRPAFHIIVMLGAASGGAVPAVQSRMARGGGASAARRAVRD